MVGLAGCVRAAPPLPTCNAEYVTLVGSSRCAELQVAIERVALEVFPPLTEKLRALQWTVKVDPRITTNGYTHCGPRYVVLPHDDWATSALAHELFHVLECPWENVTHARWKDEDSRGRTLEQRDGVLFGQ